MRRKILVLAIVWLLITSDENAVLAGQEQAKGYANIEELFADFREQMEAIYDVDAPKIPRITNKPSPRYYSNEFRLDSDYRYIWDVELTTYSPEFAEKYNQPKHLVSEDMPEGMHLLSYTQMTIADRVECLLKFRIDDDLGAAEADWDLANITLELAPLHLRGRAPSMKYGPDKTNRTQIGPMVISYGPAKEITGDIHKQGYKPTALRSFVHDKESKTFLYVVRTDCAPKAAERYEQGAALMINKENYAPEEELLAESKLYFPLPKTFSQMIGYFNGLVKKD